VDRLDQLFARSLREIQAHATELAETETGRSFINDAADSWPRYGYARRTSTAPTTSSGRSSRPPT